MPVSPTFPGVYIEEIPSGVRTITGVATSITAFLGRAPRGPVSQPTTIFSFADFERQFGGLGVDYPMSYAVRDFYLNGGREAIIVRLVNTDPAAKAAQTVVTAAADAAGKTGATGDTVKKAARDAANAFKDDPEKSAADAVAKAAEALPATAKPGDVSQATAKAAPAVATKAELSLDPLEDSGTALPLVANNDGAWANNLRAFVDYNVIDNSGQLADFDRKKTGQPDPKRVTSFNLTIAEFDGDGNAIRQETFLNVSADDNDSRYLPRVLRDSSDLVRVKKSGTDWVSFTLPKATIDATIDPKTKEIVQKNGRPMPLPLKQMKTPTPPGVDSPPLGATDLPGDAANKTGIYALDKADLFNLLCVPPDTRRGNLQDLDSTIYSDLADYCQRRRAMLIIDSPHEWSDNKETAASKAFQGLSGLNLSGPRIRNTALYFPRVIEPDPQQENQLDTFVPCGIIAGVMATTDVTRGVWKAPAGIDAGLNGITGLEVNLTNDENGLLNPVGINCLRTFPIIGSVVWGARTLRGADIFADDYKYVPVRRLALFLEESLYRGTQWVVFEPNDEPLWAEIRLNVGAFMHNLFVQGAFQGQTPKDAYFVKCDKETTTQNDIDLGIVNIVVGFAPLKPAEFVIIKIQQIAGDIQT